MTVEMYLVGGAVRDRILGVPSKDYDFTVVADGGWEEMRQWLLSNGFTIFLENPEYFTVRAHFPVGWSFAGEDMSRTTGDFVLARKDGKYSDGRRPDSVELGALYDDLARRDFTINAMALSSTGELIDPFNGEFDLDFSLLRAVGRAEDRLREDSLRALRAIRFCVTKNLSLERTLNSALNSTWLPVSLKSVSVERKREELYKCFKADTVGTLRYLYNFPYIRYAIFTDGLWLEPTLKS